MTKKFNIDNSKMFMNNDTSGKTVYTNSNGKTRFSESWSITILGVNPKDKLKYYMDTSKIQIAEGTFISIYEYNDNYENNKQKKLVVYYTGLDNNKRVKVTYFNNWTSVKYKMIPTQTESITVLINAINLLGSELKKDLVVVDTNQNIIADRVASEVGTHFNHDKKDEVGQTLKDGRSRTFKEISEAYPNGINLKVSAIHDSEKNIIGGLIREV